MTQNHKMLKKLPLIFAGILIGLLAAFLIDNYREQQSKQHVVKILGHMQQNNLIDWNNDIYLQGFNSKSIKILQEVGALNEFTIISNDTSYTFDNDNGLHPVAFVKANAKHQKGAIEIVFKLYKNNGKWATEKVYVKKKS